MRLMDLLTEELIQPQLAAGTRDGVIDELLQLLIRAGSLPPTALSAAREAVLTREATQTTGLGSGVAVPHGLCEEVDEVVGALGVHPRGVDFSAVDARPVELVILLLVPPNHIQTHIRTLAGIARVLNDPGLRRTLIAAGSAGEVLRVLEEREGAAV